MILPAVVCLGFLLLPFCAYQVGPAWPSDIRDRGILICAWCGAVAMLPVEPGLAILFALALLRWRDHSSASAPVMLGLACLLYLLVRYGPESVPRATQAGIVAAAMGQAVWCAVSVVQAKRRFKVSWQAAREAGRGAMGNRVMVGHICAMAMPLAPVWALPVLGLGLVASCTYTAIGSAILALLVVHPGWWWEIALLVGGTLPFLWWWRGNPVDSMVGRIQVLRLVVAALYHADWCTRMIGFGPGRFPAAGRYWASRHWVGQVYRHAHNDLVHVAYENGLVAVLAVLVWAGHMVPTLRVGDPLTGALVVVVVGCLNLFPSFLPHTALPMLAVVAMLARRL